MIALDRAGRATSLEADELVLAVRSGNLVDDGSDAMTRLASASSALVGRESSVPS